MSRLTPYLVLTTVVSSGFADDVLAASQEAIEATSRPEGAQTTPAIGSIDLLDDALLELAQQSLDEGLAHEAAGNELAALEALRTAQEIVPDDARGVIALRGFVPTPDGRGYAYSYVSQMGTLYLAEGLR